MATATMATTAIPARALVKGIWPTAFGNPGEASADDNATVHRFFCADGQRYAFDFAMCGMRSDWYQLDTDQDAWYFGTWCNPVTRQIVCYCEGDISVTTARSADAYKHEVAHIVSWNADRKGWARIDDHDGKHDAKLGAA